jgi:glycosyltransferase involved in cell wall biosynthesis
VFGGDSRGKVAVVYNGIERPPALDPHARRIMRDVDHLLPDAPLIGYSGRLHPEKGIETLLAAFKVLSEKIPAARLWIVGAPMPGEESYQDVIVSVSEKLGLKNLVKFWGWQPDGTELMSCFDLCVVPSLREPFGRVTVEAMMLGVPVVAAASGGTLEIIADGEDGLLFPPGDAGALAARCLKLINDPTLKQRLIRHAAEKATSKFGQAQYIAGTLAVYAPLAGEQTSR